MQERPGGAGWRAVTAAVLLGVVAGYGSLALQAIGLVLVAVLTVLIVNRLRRRPAGVGAYFALLGATGSVILAPVVIGGEACTGSPGDALNCYSPSTFPALVAYIAICVAGLGITVYSTFRQIRTRR